MRVLHLTPELPFRTGGGGRPLEYFFCRRLVENGHAVLNLSPVMPDEVGRAADLKSAGVETRLVVRSPSPPREAANAVLREPRVLATAVVQPVRALEMRVFWTRLRAAALRAEWEWRPDIVVIGHDMAAGWVCDLDPGRPAVLRLHNLTWRWYRSRADRENLIRGAPLRAEAWRYQRHVQRLLARFTHLMALSSVEADELERLTDVPVAMIPPAIEIGAQAPGPPSADPTTLLFTGTLSYPPNVEGICWFVLDVWPRLRARMPQLRLEIVGRDPDPRVRSLGGAPGVTVVGPVVEMSPYLAAADVVIAPIITGAGVRVKIVEAMAAGRPLVSTALGCEGLPFLEPGHHLLVADGVEPFARAVISLIEDAGLRTRLGDAARAVAMEQFDWRVVGDRQQHVLEEALAAGPVSANRRSL